MRNKFGGTCYKCGLWVTPGTGHFERHKGRWRTQHGIHPGHGRITCDEAARNAVQSEVEKNRLETVQTGCVS